MNPDVKTNKLLIHLFNEFFRFSGTALESLTTKQKTWLQQQNPDSFLFKFYQHGIVSENNEQLESACLSEIQKGTDSSNTWLSYAETIYGYLLLLKGNRELGLIYLNHAISGNNMFAMLLLGQGLPSVKLIKRSVALGCRAAMLELGHAFRHGDYGLNVNLSKSKMWYERAFDLGCNRAGFLLSGLLDCHSKKFKNINYKLAQRGIEHGFLGWVESWSKNGRKDPDDIENTLHFLSRKPEWKKEMKEYMKPEDYQHIEPLLTN